MRVLRILTRKELNTYFPNPFGGGVLAFVVLMQALVTEAAGHVEAGDPVEFTLQTVKTPGVQNWSREGIYED